MQDRFGVAKAAALALPPAAFIPFDAEVAYADEIDLCLRWPDPGQPPRATGAPYPPVPTLLLQGEEDLRTPPEVSAHIAALIPGAQRVTVPGVGHAIIGGDPTGCGRRQVLRFLGGGAVRARCARVPTGVPPTGVPPTAFAQLAPARRAPGARRPHGRRRRRDARLPRLRRSRPRWTPTGAAAGCAAGATASAGASSSTAWSSCRACG